MGVLLPAPAPPGGGGGGDGTGRKKGFLLTSGACTCLQGSVFVMFIFRAPTATDDGLPEGKTRSC